MTAPPGCCYDIHPDLVTDCAHANTTVSGIVLSYLDDMAVQSLFVKTWQGFC